MKSSKTFDCSEKQLWATCLNFVGIWNKKPTKVIRHKMDQYDESDPPFSYWDRGGNLLVKGEGLEVLNPGDGCVIYASRSKEDVELFIQQAEEAQKAMLGTPVPEGLGAQAVMLRMRKWAWTIK